jgi:hypothetical protein
MLPPVQDRTALLWSVVPRLLVAEFRTTALYVIVIVSGVALAEFELVMVPRLKVTVRPPATVRLAPVQALLKSAPRDVWMSVSFERVIPVQPTIARPDCIVSTTFAAGSVPSGIVSVTW